MRTCIAVIQLQAASTGAIGPAVLHVRIRDVELHGQGQRLIGIVRGRARGQRLAVDVRTAEAGHEADWRPSRLGLNHGGGASGPHGAILVCSANCQRKRVSRTRFHVARVENHGCPVTCWCTFSRVAV